MVRFIDGRHRDVHGVCVANARVQKKFLPRGLEKITKTYVGVLSFKCRQMSALYQYIYIAANIKIIALNYSEYVMPTTFCQRIYLFPLRNMILYLGRTTDDGCYKATNIGSILDSLTFQDTRRTPSHSFYPTTQHPPFFSSKLQADTCYPQAPHAKHS